MKTRLRLLERSHGRKILLLLAIAVIIAGSLSTLSFLPGMSEHGLATRQSLGLAPAPPGSSIPPSTPLVSPSFDVLLNGSAQYPSYTVQVGQNLSILLDIRSTRPLPLTLLARPQNPPGSAVPLVTMRLGASQIMAPASGVVLYITVAKNASPGVYPMAVDAIYNTGQGRVVFQAGFNLIVQG